MTLQGYKSDKPTGWYLLTWKDLTPTQPPNQGEGVFEIIIQICCNKISLPFMGGSGRGGNNNSLSNSSHPHPTSQWRRRSFRNEFTDLLENKFPSPSGEGQGGVKIIILSRIHLTPTQPPPEGGGVSSSPRSQSALFLWSSSCLSSCVSFESSVLITLIESINGSNCLRKVG